MKERRSSQSKWVHGHHPQQIPPWRGARRGELILSGLRAAGDTFHLCVSCCFSPLSGGFCSTPPQHTFSTDAPRLLCNFVWKWSFRLGWISRVHKVASTLFVFNRVKLHFSVFSAQNQFHFFFNYTQNKSSVLPVTLSALEPAGLQKPHSAPVWLVCFVLHVPNQRVTASVYTVGKRIRATSENIIWGLSFHQSHVRLNFEFNIF